MTDELNKYLEKYIKIQKDILLFLEDEENSRQLFDNFITIFDKPNFEINFRTLTIILNMLSNISNNHHRDQFFYKKIFQILMYLFKDIKKCFSNKEIYKIFQHNERILLFLIENKIVKIDSNIANIIINEKYSKNKQYLYYFYPEIEKFLSLQKKSQIQKEIYDILPSFNEDYLEKRRIGENDSYICSLIRDDMIEDFVIFVNRTNYSLSNKITKSIFDPCLYIDQQKKPKEIQTKNKFKKRKLKDSDELVLYPDKLVLNPDEKKIIQSIPSLIEYAAFFGSIQIFQYLLFNKVKLTSSLWLYAIHGNNPQIIHILEDYHVEIPDGSYELLFYQSVLCHHNDLANYFKDNFMENIDKNFLCDMTKSIKLFNFEYFPDNFNENEFFSLCKYNYLDLVGILSKFIDINTCYKMIYI